MNLKAQIERYLVDSVLDTVSITAKNPTVVVEGNLPFKQDILLNAIIPFGGQLEGFVQFSIGRKNAQKLVGFMLGEGPIGDTFTVNDGISELANIIAGNLKRLLSVKGYSYSIGLPRVISTHNEMFQENDAGATHVQKQFICEELLYKVSIQYKLVDLETVEKSMEDVVPEVDAEMLLRTAIEDQLKDSLEKL